MPDFDLPNKSQALPRVRGGSGLRVSVVMPAYNAELTIEMSLLSALNQSLAPLEIIVVDDGSTDGTSAIVKAMANEYSSIKLSCQSNEGPIAARNRAISLSHGAFVAPLDADDIWHGTYLERLVGALEAAGEDAGFSYSLYRMIDARSCILFDGNDFGCEGWTIIRHLYVNYVGNGSSAVFRRQALLEARGYPVEATDWHGAEDYLLQMRIAATRQVVQVREYLVGYRRSPSSYSASAPDAALSARMKAITIICSEFNLTYGNARKWANADGWRTSAAFSAMQGDWLDVSTKLLQALRLDFYGTIIELALRFRNGCRRACKNALRRIFRLSSFDASFIDTPYFAADPGRRFSSGVDELTRRRLASLASFEIGRAERID